MSELTGSELTNIAREAESFADALLPIPPRVCFDSEGKLIKDDRCKNCPMRTPCELKQSWSNSVEGDIEHGK